MERLCLLLATCHDISEPVMPVDGAAFDSDSNQLLAHGWPKS